MIEVEQLGNVYVLHWHDDENRFNRDLAGRAQRRPRPGREGRRARAPSSRRARASTTPTASTSTGSCRRATRPTASSTRCTGCSAACSTFPAITVAAINGHAFAGGAMLASAHDFRVMREDRGYWCLPEVDLGLPLTPSMAAVITAKLPRETAHEAMMTGQRYDAVEAQMAGIVNLTAAEDDVLADAVDLATDFAEKNRGVVAEPQAPALRRRAAGHRRGLRPPRPLRRPASRGPAQADHVRALRVEPVEVLHPLAGPAAQADVGGVGDALVRDRVSVATLVARPAPRRQHVGTDGRGPHAVLHGCRPSRRALEPGDRPNRRRRRHEVVGIGAVARVDDLPVAPRLRDAEVPEPALAVRCGVGAGEAIGPVLEPDAPPG